MEIRGKDRIKEIAKEVSLPDWWTESVIIEYFNCRLFGEGADACAFDYGKIGKKEISTIPEKRVIFASGFFFVQNVRSIDLAWRFSRLAIGLPSVPFDEADLIPEGLVNRTGFVYGNWEPISWDPKAEFAFKAIVRDDNRFYQWTISDKQDLPGKHYHWYKSELFDLSGLLTIHEKIQAYRNSTPIREGQPSAEMIKEIEKAYDELEAIRAPLREKILEFHETKKTGFDPSDWNMPDPPMLSMFETVKPVRNDKNELVFQVKTHVEPLLLRTAVRNYLQATEAKKKRDQNPEDQDALLEEIEHSATCIVASTNCLESYINYIFRKYLPSDAKLFETSSLGQKWMYVPHALNSPYKFNASDHPFSDFKRLVSLRNNIIHHKSEYAKISGAVSQAVSQYNADNAKLAIKVVKVMVISLSKNPTIPVPTWIKTEMGSSDYWDIVRDVLKQFPD